MDNPDQHPDQQLCQQIREILQYPDGSIEQRQAMDRLIELVPTLPGISQRKYSQIEYQEVLNQALAAISVYGGNVSHYPIRLFVNKFQLDLDSVDPAFLRLCFVKRFNRILRNITAQMFRKMGNYLSLDAPTQIHGSSTTLGNFLADRNMNLMEQAHRAEVADISKKVKRYIEQDPQRQLRCCYPKGYPQSNCQELAKRRLLSDPPDKWKEIAQTLNIPYGTVTAHWKRKCNPLLQEIVKKLGYQPERRL